MRYLEGLAKAVRPWPPIPDPTQTLNTPSNKALPSTRTASAHPPSTTHTHPTQLLQYLEGLAKAVERYGGKVYEGTKAWKAGGCCGWVGGWVDRCLQGRCCDSGLH